MAKDWYLLKSPHCQLSGFEDDALDDFAKEGFAEALESAIAVDVELYSNDLSECTQIRAIVQNTVQDTKLKSLSRHLFVQIGTCKAGMYVKYKDRFWLIVGLVDDNHMYEKAIMVMCNYLLTWVNDKNEVVQRWAHVSSASQYNNGETSSGKMSYFVARSDQLLVMTSDDDECLLLNSGMRFIIDRRCKIYEKKIGEDVTKDTRNPVIVYRLTRSDSVLYDYRYGGHFEFLATQDEQHDMDGYYVIGGKGYWLCNEMSENKNDILTCEIEYDEPEIYNGLEPGVFIAKFYDSNGNEIIVKPQWKIQSDFAGSLDVSYVDNAILISADDPNLLNKSFELFLSGEGYQPVSITISIKAFF